MLHSPILLTFRETDYKNQSIALMKPTWEGLALTLIFFGDFMDCAKRPLKHRFTRPLKPEASECFVFKLTRT